jgi:hypothetical protein
VADQYNNRVLRILSESLNTKVIVGGIRAGCGFNELSAPTDVTTDADGNLYVSVLDCSMVFMYKIDKSPCNCSCTYREFFNFVLLLEICCFLSRKLIPFNKH